MPQEDIAKQVLEQKKIELYSKWIDKFSVIDKDNVESIQKFYRVNKFELYKDLEEFYDMCVTLSIKGE